MRVAQDLIDSVVFFGHGDDKEFSPKGTGFLLIFGGLLYLATARHVAENLGEDPFLIRANHNSGRANNYPLDLCMSGDTRIRWFAHEMESVDLAVLPFPIDAQAMGITASAIHGEHTVKLEKPMKDAGCGDMCHVVGLFAHRPGVNRNMPVVHTGHIAAMCDSEELIFVSSAGKTKRVEGYLVELSNLGGLSGAPVFVRGGVELNVPIADGPQRVISSFTPELKLLGVWQGSWNRGAVGTAQDTVAMGIVTPGHRLLQLLDSEPVAENRREWLEQ